MSESLFYGLLVLVAFLAAALGAFVTHLYSQKRIVELRETNARLDAKLEAERRVAAEKLAALEQARNQLTATFSALSSQALKSNSEEFLKLARENLEQYHVRAQGALEQKEKSIESLVKPIRETLEKTEKQIRLMEHERKEAHGSLTRYIETMTQGQQQLEHETRRLVNALKRPEVRGQWGEMTLKRLAELSGMVEHCDFYEQENINTEEGRIRPDMIVRMPDGREIVVDVKTPLDAYLNAMEATDDETRESCLKHHARKVRERVKELASKAYWNQFENAPDFVVLFIPGDQFFAAALDHDRNLIEDALRQNVIIATPTNFVALLRAIAYGWRQEKLTANAAEIRTIGEELYGRLATFSEHLARLGRNLDSSIENYNKAVGSFGRRVLPAARRFVEMGISEKKSIEEPNSVDRISRQSIHTGNDDDLSSGNS